MDQNTTAGTPKEARKTAFIVAAVLGIIAFIFLYRERPTVTAVLAAIALGLILIGAFIPPLAMLFHRGWMRFAFALGYVNSRILLTLVYFLIFVPYAVVSRLAGRDPLDLRGGPRTSYWHKRKLSRQPKGKFERLF